MEEITFGFRDCLCPNIVIPAIRIRRLPEGTNAGTFPSHGVDYRLSESSAAAGAHTVNLVLGPARHGPRWRAADPHGRRRHHSVEVPAAVSQRHLRSQAPAQHGNLGNRSHWPGSDRYTDYAPRGDLLPQSDPDPARSVLHLLGPRQSELYGPHLRTRISDSRIWEQLRCEMGVFELVASH